MDDAWHMQKYICTNYEELTYVLVLYIYKSGKNGAVNMKKVLFIPEA